MHLQRHLEQPAVGPAQHRQRPTTTAAAAAAAGLLSLLLRTTTSLQLAAQRPCSVHHRRRVFLLRARAHPQHAVRLLRGGRPTVERRERRDAAHCCSNEFVSVTGLYPGIEARHCVSFIKA
jgi:hypothetical protein